MTEQQYKDLVEKVGKEAADKIKAEAKAIEDALTTKFQDVTSGLMSREDFDKFKNDVVAPLNEKLATLITLEEAVKAQGTKINAILEGANGAKPKSIDEFLALQIPKLAQLKKAGTGVIEITGSELKAAGVTSIGGSISPSSPYLPGIDGTALELFDIVRNPNFMLTRVDLGGSNQYKLAWVNETGFEGAVDTNIAESGLKPLIQHKFSVEISTAKKAAAYMKLTEEFEDDVPGLASDVRNMLQSDVIRAFDDQIQFDVFAVAKPFQITGFNADIADANLWDALYVLGIQPKVYNFQTNTYALNPITEGKIKMGKNVNGTYLSPPFAQEIQNALVTANKIPVNSALAGDLRQYKVRTYKDYTLRMGWINDQFIHNEFAILGEIRYHSFISDNRKWALAKGDLNAIALQIDGTPGS